MTEEQLDMLDRAVFTFFVLWGLGLLLSAFF